MSRRELGIAAFGIELEEIIVSPPVASLAPNDEQQFTAVAHYSGGVAVDVTSSATWITNHSSIATVDSTGLVTAVAGGDAKITARLGSKSGSAHVAVSGEPASEVVFQYTVQQPADGSDFFVDLPDPFISDIYAVHPEVIAGRLVFFMVPDDDVGDRTTTRFRVVTSAPMDNGDIIEFTVFPG